MAAPQPRIAPPPDPRIAPSITPGPGFDPKKSGLAALKYGLILALGQFISDTSGISDYLVAHFDLARQVGPAVIAMGLAMLKNAISNWTRA